MQVVLRIERIYTATGPKTKVYTDGEVSRFNYELSRLLTSTTAEDGNGIFTECPEDCMFERGECSVVVDFDGPWEIGNKTVPELIEDIKKRIAIVDEAFKSRVMA